jgi:hypothetical protein
MNRRWRLLFAAVSFGVGASALADALPDIPTAAMPTVKCIYRVLKSSTTIQSVSLYSIDGFRFAAEYVFRNKADQVVVSDIELLIDPNGSVTETDKIPREISEETANEGEDLESKLDLNSKCHLAAALDNLLPEPRARADWRRIDWPKV